MYHIHSAPEVLSTLLIPTTYDHTIAAPTPESTGGLIPHNVGTTNPDNESPTGYPTQTQPNVLTPPQASSTNTPVGLGNTSSLSATLQPAPTPATPTGSSITDLDIDPQLLAVSNAAPVNLCLERVKANSDKKRKQEEKTASASSKKQKTKAVGLAIPNDTNTLRCV